MLLQSLSETVVEWATLALLVLGPGVVAAVLWSPFLAAARMRALFRRLPPTESVVPTYLLVTVGGSLPYVVGVVWALVRTTDEAGSAMANAILDVIVPLSFGYVVAFPILAGVVLPRADYDWDPTGYGPGTWVLLVAGGLWYATLFGVPLFLISLVLALPT